MGKEPCVHVEGIGVEKDPGYASLCLVYRRQKAKKVERKEENILDDMEELVKNQVVYDDINTKEETQYHEDKNGQLSLF